MSREHPRHRPSRDAAGLSAELEEILGAATSDGEGDGIPHDDQGGAELVDELQTSIHLARRGQLPWEPVQSAATSTAVTPADVTPATATPATVTPAAVTPAGATPAASPAVAPLSSHGRVAASEPHAAIGYATRGSRIERVVERPLVAHAGVERSAGEDALGSRPPVGDDIDHGANIEGGTSESSQPFIHPFAEPQPVLVPGVPSGSSEPSVGPRVSSRTVSGYETPPSIDHESSFPPTQPHVLPVHHQTGTVLGRTHGVDHAAASAALDDRIRSQDIEALRHGMPVDHGSFPVMQGDIADVDTPLLQQQAQYGATTGDGDEILPTYPDERHPNAMLTAAEKDTAIGLMGEPPNPDVSEPTPEIDVEHAATVLGLGSGAVILVVLGVVISGLSAIISSDFNDKFVVYSDWKNRGQIPRKYGCLADGGAGHAASIPLRWENLPPGTKSLVVLVANPGMIKIDETDPVHWFVSNITVAEEDKVEDASNATDHHVEYVGNSTDHGGLDGDHHEQSPSGYLEPGSGNARLWGFPSAPEQHDWMIEPGASQNPSQLLPEGAVQRPNIAHKDGLYTPMCTHANGRASLFIVYVYAVDRDEIRIGPLTDARHIMNRFGSVPYAKLAGYYG